MTVIVAAGILVMWRSLAMHHREWSVDNLRYIPGSVWHKLEAATRVDQSDGLYTASLCVGVMVSLLALLTWVWLYRRLPGPSPKY
jgi:hypothetical protein